LTYLGKIGARSGLTTKSGEEPASPNLQAAHGLLTFTVFTIGLTG